LREWPQILNIATDGESYGHHHKFGDMALAYALNYIESNGIARLTNYGDHLEKHPPTHEVENHRKYLVELYSRHREMEEQLRMQLRRTSRMEAGMEGASPAGAGLAKGAVIIQIRT